MWAGENENGVLLINNYKYIATGANVLSVRLMVMQV